MSPQSLRLTVAAIVLAIVVVASLPLLMLLDLAAGGDGYGLCPRGLASCQTSYATGPELGAVLVLVLFVLLGVLRAVLVIARRARSQSMSGTDRLRQG